LAKETVEFPISGKVTKVLVKQGDKVSEGDVLCMLESMKMENPIVAPVTGTVAEVGAAPGKVVEVGNQVCIIDY
jgi:biotin carboxyl carrier protein